jgi:hypothetical protein
MGSPDNRTVQSVKMFWHFLIALFCLFRSIPPLTSIQGTFDILMSELTSSALSQGTCVLEGIFLRGGIDIGFWYRRNDSLISPALVRAYKLERDACVPMIAITPDLRKYLANNPERRFYRQDLDPIPKTLKQYRKVAERQSSLVHDNFTIFMSSSDAASNT